MKESNQVFQEMDLKQNKLDKEKELLFIKQCNKMNNVMKLGNGWLMNN